jgi:hypothetical protein
MALGHEVSVHQHQTREPPRATRGRGQGEMLLPCRALASSPGMDAPLGPLTLAGTTGL